MKLNVNITIKDHNTGAYLVIPVLPDRVEYQEGDKLADTVSIINLGDVDFLSGSALDTFGWAAEFPAKYDPSYVKTRGLKQPKQYKEQFKSWKDKGTPLQLICTAAGINERMYLKSFTWDLRNEGDIYYQVSFKQLKIIAPKKVKSYIPKGPAAEPSNPPPIDISKPSRPPAPTTPQPKSYTVVRGDCLIRIAKKFGISDWRGQLYNPNKKPNGPLGSNPSLIYPGQVLKLP
ncbi:LysM peptidoglycan-binding domain-containing protein [Bacillota bacterium Lsc_1132]